MALGWALAAVTMHTLAQTSPAHGPLPSVSTHDPADARELADYLSLLQQIAPAAEGGARTYLAAVQLRCGRALGAAALRRAMAQDGGDPVMMGLIRATATQDHAARRRLVAQVPCAPKEQP